MPRTPMVVRTVPALRRAVEALRVRAEFISDAVEGEIAVWLGRDGTGPPGMYTRSTRKLSALSPAVSSETDSCRESRPPGLFVTPSAV